MLRKFKMWCYSFLSTVLKDSLLEDLKREQKKNDELRRELDRLQCYADGLEFGMRSMRKIQIQVGEVKK